MKMHNDYVKNWPQATRFLQELDIRLRSKHKKVLKAFLDACNADIQPTPAERKQKQLTDARTIALKALRWGINPFIVVHPGLIKMGTSACGLQLSHGGSRHRLSVTDIFFDAFEFGDSNEHNNNARRLEAIVLHEAVHWVRQEAGATTEAFDGMQSYEAGQMFERLAYGTLSCLTHEIDAAQKSISKSGLETIAKRRHELLHGSASP
jgi:hypothetical protein